MELAVDVLISFPSPPPPPPPCAAACVGVYVAGTFSNWNPLPMMKTSSGRNYEISLSLKPGIYQYKFIVNGEWTHDENCDLENDDVGGYNNMLLVEGTDSAEVPRSQEITLRQDEESSKGPNKNEKNKPNQIDAKKVKAVSKDGKEQPSNSSGKNQGTSRQPEKTTTSAARGSSEINASATKEPLVEPFPDDFKGYYPLQETLLAKLKEKGILPHKDPVVDLNAERPIGHSTHNLFVKDKSKQLFLITHAQHVSAKLNVIAQAIGAKNPRFAPKEDILSALKVESGCITVLSLLGDQAGKVKVVMDKGLLDPAAEKTLRICCGCKNPQKHDQHVVVDVPREVILEFLKETHHDPIFIPFN